MQLLADYFPLLLFFVAFKWQGIYVATAVAIAASVAQLAYFGWRRKISAVHWLSFAIIVIFGGATLWLQDDYYIKWKPTVLYSLFGLTLATGKVVFQRDLLALLLKDLALPPAVWTRLTWSWVGFFAAMAVANWYVAFHFSTDTWVNFKVWGGTEHFLGLSRLARHRAVLDRVGDLIPHPVHALAIRAYAPDEFPSSRKD